MAMGTLFESGDPAVEKGVGEALVDGFGCFLDAFVPVLRLARDDERGGGVEEHGVAVGTVLALDRKSVV